MKRGAKIKLIVLDVDGVMTDGAVYLDMEGRETKGFFIRDGFGIVMARRAGINFAIITGVMSPIVEHRAAYLHITEVHQGFQDKDEVLRGILARAGLQPSEAAYIGDDLFDLPALRMVGLSAAPADAHPDVLKAVDWISIYPGGRGAVRELIELILMARGDWNAVRQEFVKEV